MTLLRTYHGSRRVRWRLLIVCAAGTIHLTAKAAHAQPVTIVYAAPSECPSAPSVIERIAGLVRRQPLVPTAAKATISRLGKSYLLELKLDGGSRHIVSESCDSLVQTLAVILSLAVEPRTHSLAREAEPLLPEPTSAELGKSPESGELGELVESAKGTKPLPTGTAPPIADTGRVAKARASPSATPKNAASPAPLVAHSAPVTATDRPEKPEDAASSVSSPATGRRASALELRAALLLWTEYGMMPHFAHGPNAGVWFDLSHWSLGVTAVGLLPQWVSMPLGDMERGGYLSFVGGQLSGCALVVGPRLVGLCAGVEAGDMMGKGSGVSSTKLGHGVWLAGTAEVVVRPRFWSKMSAELRLGLSLPVKRPAFGIDGYSWRVEPHGWSLRLASGFSWF